MSLSQGPPNRSDYNDQRHEPVCFSLGPRAPYLLLAELCLAPPIASAVLGGCRSLPRSIHRKCAESRPNTEPACARSRTLAGTARKPDACPSDDAAHL